MCGASAEIRTCSGERTFAQADRLTLRRCPPSLVRRSDHFLGGLVGDQSLRSEFDNDAWHRRARRGAFLAR
jgi:hypothetical protein